MISGLYSAASGMDAAAVRHETSAENLAHAHQPGYRRRVIRQTTFETILQPLRDTSSMAKTLGTSAAGNSEGTVHIDFQSGPLKQTGRALDVALQGDGFFVVDGPDGPLYTRNGGFHVDSDGRIVTVDQLPLLGQGGPLTLPTDVSSEAVQISANGEVSAAGKTIGQLQLAAFEDVSVLRPAGVSLFAAPPDAGVQDADVRIVQGFLEQSNVAAIDELVNIMIGSRQYEAARKAMSAIEQAIQRHVGVG